MGPFFAGKERTRKVKSEPFLFSWDFSSPLNYTTKTEPSHPRRMTIHNFGRDLANSPAFSNSDNNSWSTPPAFLSYDQDPAVTSYEDVSSSSADIQEKMEKIFDKSLKEVKYFQNLPIAGTSDGLMAALFLDEAQVDGTYLDLFLATHSCFLNSKELFDLLKDVYFGANRWAEFKILAQRALAIIKRWFELFPTDFRSGSELNKEISVFGNVISELRLDSLQLKSPSSSFQSFNNYERDKASLNGQSPNSIKFLEFQPAEVARQLALLDWEKFASIPPSEFLSEAESLATQHWINDYERGINWVASEIITTPNPKQRAVVIKRFIEIAEYSLRINNIHGVAKITTALGLSFVARLKTSWKDVSQKYISKLKSLQGLLTPMNGYSKLKAYQAQVALPLVPHHNLLSQELEEAKGAHSSIHSHHDDLDNSSVSQWVNFNHMKGLGAILLRVAALQATPFKFKQVPEMRNYLFSPPVVLSNKELVLGSRSCEPAQESPSSTTDRKVHALRLRENRKC